MLFMLNFTLQDSLGEVLVSLEGIIGSEIKILTREEVEEENHPT